MCRNIRKRYIWTCAHSEDLDHIAHLCSEDSNQTARMGKLTQVLIGHTCRQVHFLKSWLLLWQLWKPRNISACKRIFANRLICAILLISANFCWRSCDILTSGCTTGTLWRTEKETKKKNKVDSHYLKLQGTKNLSISLTYWYFR